MSKAGCSLQLRFVDRNRRVVYLWYKCIILFRLIVLHVLTACICLLTYFNIDFIRVHSSWCKARPVHINWHDTLLSITREGGHSCGVLKGISNFNQITVRIRDVYGWTIATVSRSLPVVDSEVTDVAGAVVHSFPHVQGEGDVGVVLIGLEVANNFLSICDYFRGWLAITLRQYVVGPCLPHLWVLHTVGQLWSQWTTGEERLPSV